jgi:hypothetical protein
VPFPNEETQFKQGWQGGPGRPRKDLISEAAKCYLAEAHPKYPTKTRAEVIALQWIKRANREQPALNSLLDRTEGKVPEPDPPAPEVTMEEVAKRLREKKKAKRKAKE